MPENTQTNNKRWLEHNVDENIAEFWSKYLVFHQEHLFSIAWEKRAAEKLLSGESDIYSVHCCDLVSVYPQVPTSTPLNEPSSNFEAI